MLDFKRFYLEYRTKIQMTFCYIVVVIGLVKDICLYNLVFQTFRLSSPMLF